MISNQSIPTAFPAGVLKTETLLRANKCPQINNLGFSIMDRWMLNEPDLIREVEKNDMFLLYLILNQQVKEEAVLETPKALGQMARGLTAQEILTLNGVETSLQSAIAESGAVM